MITDVKLEVERKDLKTVEIKLQPWQAVAIFELLGMKILLNSSNEKNYKTIKIMWLFIVYRKIMKKTILK